MHDMTAVAASHTGAREQAAADRITADPAGRLGQFRQLADDSQFSTNMTADKLLAYDAADEVLDTRRYHIQQAGGDHDEGLRRFSAKQDEWLARREAFESLWQHGERLIYGAVNAGGLGAQGSYGDFCLVVEDPQTPPPDALAVFPGNSARRYATDAGNVDERAALGEATAWSCRGALAVLECGDEAMRREEPEWPAVICQPDSFLEATRAGSLPLDSLTEARLPAGLVVELEDLWARWWLGEELSPEERARAAGYDVLLKWSREHGITIAGSP